VRVKGRQRWIVTVVLLASSTLVARAAELSNVEANRVAEVTLQSSKTYDNPFVEIELDAVVTQPGGEKLRVPMFWAGGSRWCLRYASNTTGLHTFRTECSDTTNARLHGVAGQIEIVPYKGQNTLYRHGPIQIAKDRRHFEHRDGTPFFWLGDTWWKCLAKRLTWEGFQELAADRKAKGFSVIQIVCGPYPDEDAFEPMWANEGGWPYHTRDYKELNVDYWNYADRRLQHLIDVGLVPAIVGAWGRHDCDAMKVAGVEGLKRHWRYLVARYGAYPVFWILGGELPQGSKRGIGPWGEVGRYAREIDPYQHPITIHGGGPRGEGDGDYIITFDMVGGSHRQDVAISSAVNNLTSSYAKEPPMPVLVGETCYEGHMQTGFPYIQRHMFWQFMLSGAAGHTYGAAGIWHASVEGDPGCASSAFGGRKVYDWTTWREGMNYPGATQIGLGKKLLEEYPWYRFEPHPEWAEAGSFAAGIPGEVRFIYQPRRNIYNWNGTVVKNLERDVAYSAFYFDPASGRRFDQGMVKNIPTYAPIDGHRESPFFVDRFNEDAVGADSKVDASSWKDYGSVTQRKEGSLVGGKDMVTIAEKVRGKDLMASADAKSNAEAGIILRFHDADNYIVALYSPILKSIFIHDRKDGSWGGRLGEVSVPEIGSDIQLTAAVTGEYAALVVTDGKKTWRTPAVTIQNKTAGRVGLWLYQPGVQKFDNFEVSATTFVPVDENEAKGQKPQSYDYKAPDLPSPQDWVLVLERVKE